MKKVNKYILFILFLSIPLKSLAIEISDSVTKKCTIYATKEENSYEKEYNSLVKESKGMSNFDPEKKLYNINVLSLACQNGFAASKKGLDKKDFSEYITYEIYTKSGISEAEYSWIKPMLIKMVNYGYSLDYGILN
ncbi:hypothetical protein [Mangrovibacter phragmitis]|uniref:hypothetical protein n=1 Tax=Mangrovibacter phragmitis TaxID=1691903 RepID=UPI003369CF7A